MNIFLKWQAKNKSDSRANLLFLTWNVLLNFRLEFEGNILFETTWNRFWIPCELFSALELFSEGASPCACNHSSTSSSKKNVLKAFSVSRYIINNPVKLPKYVLKERPDPCAYMPKWSRYALDRLLYFWVFKCHIFATRFLNFWVLISGCLLHYLQPRVFGMQMWHLPSLPQIHSSVFTFLLHICRVKNCNHHPSSSSS